MALELKQTVKLSQQLVMTPQLQQAIKLLQLSQLELVDAVQQELTENPLLEEVPEEEAGAEAAAEGAAEASADAARASEGGDAEVSPTAEERLELPAAGELEEPVAEPSTQE